MWLIAVVPSASVVIISNVNFRHNQHFASRLYSDKINVNRNLLCPCRDYTEEISKPTLFLGTKVFYVLTHLTNTQLVVKETTEHA